MLDPMLEVGPPQSFGNMDGWRFTTFRWEIDPVTYILLILHWHIMTTAGTAVLHFRRNRFLLHAFSSLGRESFGTAPLILRRKLLSETDVMPFGHACDGSWVKIEEATKPRQKPLASTGHLMVG